MNDATTTVNDLRQAVGNFVKERDWSQFHSPKNLSMAIAIEAAELMEHFQWLSTEESIAVRESPVDLQQVREELADILCFSLSLANALDIDVSSSVRDKIVKNALKYPAERFRGRFR
ncbi:MAG TPA: nucleotide pyrophosphohydrolase [Phycisphaerae bacterium]|nr:nucleotide pyrophosphohydrolase [Phycisphaerae bacterium]